LVDGENVAVTVELACLAALVERDRGRYADALQHWERARGLLPGLPAGAAGDQWRVRVHVGLGDAYRRACRYPPAVATLTSAKRLIDAGDGVDGTGLTAVAMMLGMIAKELGEFTDAEHWYDLVRQLNDHEGVTDVVAAALEHNLAGLAHARQQYSVAERRARKALELRRGAPGSNSVDVAQDMAVLAAALAGQGRLDEACGLFNDAMAACLSARPARDYEVGVHLHSLAAIAQQRGSLSEAERLYRQALAIKKRLLGPIHPEVALVENNLGTLFSEQGRTAEAAGCHLRALAIAAQVHHREHPLVRAARDNLDRLSAPDDRPVGWSADPLARCVQPGCGPCNRVATGAGWLGTDRSSRRLTSHRLHHTRRPVLVRLTGGRVTRIRQILVTVAAGTLGWFALVPLTTDGLTIGLRIIGSNHCEPTRAGPAMSTVGLRASKSTTLVASHESRPQQEGLAMRSLLRFGRRMLLLAAAVSGCVAVASSAAQAMISVNHCEPGLRKD
jgi:tetratricopeptide (TPR) repeat protein